MKGSVIRPATVRGARSACPSPEYRLHVIPCGTVRRVGTRRWPGGFLSRKGRFERFCGFHPCLNDEVRDEARAGGFHRRVWWHDATAHHSFPVLPAIGADLVKRRSKAASVRDSPSACSGAGCSRSRTVRCIRVKYHMQRDFVTRTRRKDGKMFSGACRRVFLYRLKTAEECPKFL